MISQLVAFSNPPRGTSHRRGLPDLLLHPRLPSLDHQQNEIMCFHVKKCLLVELRGEMRPNAFALDELLEPLSCTAQLNVSVGTRVSDALVMPFAMRLLPSRVVVMVSICNTEVFLFFRVFHEIFFP